MSFNRPVTMETSQLGEIANAYRTAGIKPPSRTTEALAAIQAEPGAEAVALELAAEAYDATDAAEWLQEALTRVARAQAADALRKALPIASQRVARVKMSEVIATAVSDLTPAFAKMTGDLAAAAKKLDNREPLSVDNAVRDDSTKALKQAQSIVNTLGVFAGIHLSRPLNGAHPALVKVLPLIDIPDCTVELVAATLNDIGDTLNEQQLTGTRTVRDLARALERDTDTALIGIARGDYEGVTLALADRATLSARSKTARAAFVRKTATLEDRQRVSVG